MAVRMLSGLLLCICLAAGARPKPEDGHLVQADSATPLLANRDVPPDSPQDGSGAAAVGLNAGGKALPGNVTTRTFCDLVHYAMPNLPANVSMVSDEMGEACDVIGLEAAECYTTHSLWSCVLQGGGCKCKWRPFCYDVRSRVGAKDARLLCRPNLGFGTCQCWGWERCPTAAGSWQCHQAARASIASQDKWQLLEGDYLRHSLEADSAEKGRVEADPTKIQEDLLNAGSCHCHQDRMQIPVPFSPEEEKALMNHALVALPLSQNATAAGIPIENKESDKDDSGKTRLALTINTKKGPNSPKLASDSGSLEPDRTYSSGGGLNTLVAPNVLAADPANLPEHCVITDGVVVFNTLHVVVLLLMMFPVALVLLLILCCNSGMIFQLWFGRNDLPLQYDHGRRRSSLGTLRATPPLNLTILLVLLMVLMKINVTSVLTTAHVIIDSLESKGAFPAVTTFVYGRLQVPAAGLASGILLASEPLGGIFGVLVVGAYLLRRPKETVLASCALVLVCSLGFELALRWSSLSMMIFLRFVSGLAEGSLYLGHVYLARLSAPEVRTKIFGYWELGTAAGLVSGPALASFLATGPWTEFLPGPGEPMAVCIALLSFCLLVAIAAFFPETSELCADGAVGARPLSGAAMTDQAWTVQLTLSGSTIVRLLLRLAWESAAAIVLATHFCLGHRNSGYGITLTFLLYMAGQSFFVMYCEKFSDHTLIRFCEFLELIGLVVMFRVPSDVETTLMEDVIGTSAFVRLAQFLFGSALFYTGNCLTSAPLSSWATKFGPGSESVMFFAHIAIQSGVFAGGLLSRVFTSLDPHQNMIVAMLLPVVCLQILLSELGLGITHILASTSSCHVEE